MNLGISSLGFIVEYGQVKKDEYSSLLDLLLDASQACLKFSEDHGFEVCELIVDPPEVFSQENKQKFVDLCNSYSFEIQIHGPFIDMGLCSHNEKISEASVQSYIETAKICEEIEATTLTIHPGVANFLINSIKGYNQKRLKHAVMKLLEATKDVDVMICMENMPQNAKILLDEKEMEQFFSEIGRDDLFFTYDTSHAWTCDTDIEYLWEKLHPLIKNVHLVDNFEKKSDTHPALGSGKIDFGAIFDLIKKYNYQRSLIIELSRASDLEQSIEFIQQYL